VKNVLDITHNYWTQFKKFAPPLENYSLPLVSQAGYGPGQKGGKNLKISEKNAAVLVLSGKKQISPLLGPARKTFRRIN